MLAQFICIALATEYDVSSTLPCVILNVQVLLHRLLLEPLFMEWGGRDRHSWVIHSIFWCRPTMPAGTANLLASCPPFVEC